MRRVVVVLMNAEIREDFTGKIPDDPVSRIDFVLRYVHTRLTNPYMPVSPLSVLLTLMGSRFKEISKYLVAVEDTEENEDDVICANCIVAGAMGLSVETVGDLARRISSYRVCKIDGQTYIKDIVPSNLYRDTLESP